tara:strand:+ start:3684 stop:3896 length:213 start_codon:yes stop_codon:yes gene_type:complete
MLKRCNGTPNANQYSNGCRCAECTEAWRVRAAQRKETDRARRKGIVSGRDTSNLGYAFTKQDIMKARGYE